MSAGKLSCSSCSKDIEEGDVDVVILTKNVNGWDFNEGWTGVICHKACADNMTWGSS